jgi:hypothetical protein
MYQMLVSRVSLGGLGKGLDENEGRNRRFLPVAELAALADLAPLMGRPSCLGVR